MYHLNRTDGFASLASLTIASVISIIGTFAVVQLHSYTMQQERRVSAALKQDQAHEMIRAAIDDRASCTAAFFNKPKNGSITSLNFGANKLTVGSSLPGTSNTVTNIRTTLPANSPGFANIVVTYNDSLSNTLKTMTFPALVQAKIGEPSKIGVCQGSSANANSGEVSAITGRNVVFGNKNMLTNTTLTALCTVAMGEYGAALCVPPGSGGASVPLPPGMPGSGQAGAGGGDPQAGVLEEFAGAIAILQWDATHNTNFSGPYLQSIAGGQSQQNQTYTGGSGGGSGGTQATGGFSTGGLVQNIGGGW